RMNLTPAEDRGRLPQVGHGPVRAVPDVDLVDRHRTCLRDALDVARKMRDGDQRLERRQVELEALPEGRVGVGALPGPGAPCPALEGALDLLVRRAGAPSRS